VFGDIRNARGDQLAGLDLVVVVAVPQPFLVL
jgi:hypothetical protein